MVLVGGAPAQGVLVTFEEGVGNDGGIINTQYSGITFQSATSGFPWYYSDVTTGNYNASSWPTGQSWGTGNYWINEFAAAWTSVAGDDGKIAFDNQDATFVQINYSSYSAFYLEAYNAGDVLLDTDMGPANLRFLHGNGGGPGTVRVDAPPGETIAYVLVHDSGNYWIVDNVLTDATGIQTPADLQIVKFLDANGNGALDGGEGLAGGWQFHVTGPCGFDTTVTTGASGTVSLDSLMGGEYTITEITQAGCQVTTPNPQVIAIGDQSGTAVVQFGNNCSPAPATRGGTSQKGSLVVFPKVELRWDAATGNLIQDTFVDLTNDYPGLVLVLMYFVNGDPPAPAVYDGATLLEREHPGYNWVDNEITLTGNEPAFWSALTGLEKGVSPFTVLDPPAGPFNPADPNTWPGRPANDGSGDRVLRGFVLAWAVNADGVEIRWNHLKGDALVLDYDDTLAWEYNAWAFQAVTCAAHGEPTGSPGELLLDGIEYDACPSLLLLDFYASGSHALSGGHDVEVISDTDLTLLPMWIDVRQDNGGPVTTKAKFDIWNQNEVKFSNTERCITFWDQQWLSLYQTPNHFLRQHLQTNKGKARIEGMASAVVCGQESVNVPLLGVAAKLLTFLTVGPADYEATGLTPVGMGFESGRITYDLQEPPPELPLLPGAPDTDVAFQRVQRVTPTPAPLSGRTDRVR